eukprot:TRINITY_DN5290_c0_g1_i1.p1 TRINITY_DN5290_c0_g1~~TRINITY_DN5290_c0_g1_i1.p1  ORF type:complete len:332 (-),score=45.05 TRINITY_DN5290_c0_g1_i1:240-1235(-)
MCIRDRYLVGQQSQVSYSNTGNNFTISISHSKPPDVNTLVGMCVFAFTVDPDTDAKYNLYKINRNNRDGLMYFDIILTGDEIKNNRGCKFIVEESGSYKYRCEIEVEYVSWFQRKIQKAFKTTVNFAVPKNAMQERLALDNPPVNAECNCVLRSNLNYSTKIYKGTDCKKQITSKDAIQYGDYICLEIAGEDPTTKSHLLSLRVMQMTQRINNVDQVITNVLDQTDARNNLSNRPEEGKLRAIYQVYAVGNLRFMATVALEGIKQTVTVKDQKKSVDVGMKVWFDDIVHVTGVGHEEALEPWYCGSTLADKSKAADVTVIFGLLLALLLLL